MGNRRILSSSESTATRNRRRVKYCDPLPTIVLRHKNIAFPRCLALKPLVSHQRYTSQVLQIRSHQPAPRYLTAFSRILKAIPLREPTLMGRICIRRNMGKIVETPIPRTRTCVEDAAAKKTHSHTSERQGYEADQERQVKRERGSIRTERNKRQWKPPCHLESGGSERRKGANT